MCVCVCVINFSAPSFDLLAKELLGQTMSHYSPHFYKIIIELVETNDKKKKEKKISSADCHLYYTIVPSIFNRKRSEFDYNDS